MATKLLAQGWSDIRPSDVFRCDVLSQAQNSLTWILDLSFGALLGGGNARSLLDATPLRHFLSEHIHYARIHNNIKRGHLYALAISATNYNSGKSYLFIQGKKGHPMWNRSRRVTLATSISVDHVCASAAIPLVFQPVRLKTARRNVCLGMVACAFNNLSARSYVWGQRRFLRSVSAAKISSIKKNPQIRETLRWRKSWEFSLTLCFWITWRLISSTLSG